MSTRGMIARQNGDGSKIGRYHHFDSYPSGLGQALHRLYNREVAEGGFGQDLIYMHRVLLEEHPAGWSNITGRWEGDNGPRGADFRLEPGFREYGDPAANPLDFIDGVWTANPDYVDNPRCYCHGARDETASGYLACLCNEYGDSPDGCDENFDIEYIYVLKPLGLEVWYGIQGRRGWEHRRFRLVGWDETGVTWENIDELIRAYKDAEHKLANP